MSDGLTAKSYVLVAHDGGLLWHEWYVAADARWASAGLRDWVMLMPDLDVYVELFEGGDIIAHRMVVGRILLFGVGAGDVY